MAALLHGARPGVLTAQMATTYERLISELLKVESMLLVIDSGGAVGEMDASDVGEPGFEGHWATIEAKDWHVHLDMRTIAGVQFVEAEDSSHEGIPRLFYVRLSDSDETTLLRFYFPNPWLDDDEKPTEFRPERLKQFETFRDRYVGRDGIVFVQR